MSRRGNDSFLHGSISFAGYRDVAIETVSLSKAGNREIEIIFASECPTYGYIVALYGYGVVIAALLRNFSKFGSAHADKQLS